MRLVKQMSWMKLSTVLLVLIVAAVLMTAGCTSNQTTPTTATTTATKAATPVPTTAAPVTTATAKENTTGLANPASVYCGQVGGTLEIKKDAAGNEYGMCNFPNGSSCEEWALFRGECKPNATTKNVTANATVKAPIVNKTTNATTNGTANLTSALPTKCLTCGGNNTTSK
jgi:putative hemolysin